MVEFGSGYFQPMDREYGQYGHSRNPTPKTAASTGDVGVSIGELGMSMALSPTPNIPTIAAHLRGGVKSVELAFTGAGKGSGQGHTPEMYGQKQRQALAEIQKANRVDFTTHATVGVYGLAGMDQQGNFSKQQKNFSVQEIKRAIEFAADVSKGGTVVVHTGEFHRPIVDVTQNYEDEKWKGKFRMYEEEAERASYKVVDTRTGALINEARRNRKVSRPVWNRYSEENELWKEKGGKSYLDSKGKEVKPNDYVDYFGNKINPELRVPLYDAEKKEFVVKQMGWKELEDEAKEMTLRAREKWKEFKQGKLTVTEFEKTNWGRFKDIENEEQIKVRPEEAYIISTLETNAANSRGWAIYHGGDLQRHIDNVKKLRKALEFHEKIEEATDPEEKWKLKRVYDKEFGDLLPPETKLPSEVIKKMIQENERHINYGQESASSQQSQAAEAMETIHHVESAETYALKEAYDAYAQSGIYAMMQSDKLKKEGKLKDPLAIAMENLFPETYGAHPDELISLVKNSRKRMEEMLVLRGMPSEEAEQKAKEHIVATFDTGHLNMWRKYWVGDQKKSLEENDKDFNKWMLEKVGKMADEKIIGNLHMVDNYGYQDDHLAPGEGNTPLKEIVALLKEKGYKGKMIVEPGADYTTDVSGFHSVMKAWKLFGSSVYGTGGGGGGRNWGEVGYGFFGQNAPPYFTFGGYSPSEEWTLWSGVPLE